MKRSLRLPLTLSLSPSGRGNPRHHVLQLKPLGGSRPPDPLAGVATELVALSPLGFGSGREHRRGLAPPDPRGIGGPQ